jgi:crotonobetainyl-CoA:carnitine CoA-transferase CaiB-like acyl-CoA transferase
LEYRDRIGYGQYVDVSEYESMCNSIGPAIMVVSMNKREALPQGNCPDYILAAPYGCYKCSGEDRGCVIAVFDEGEWKALCHVMGNPSWTNEEEFWTLLKRKENSRKFDAFIEQWTVQHTPEEAVDLLQEARISAGVVQNAEDLAKDPQLIAKNFFVNLDHPVLGKTTSDALSTKFKVHPKADWKAAPLLGEDNRYIFMELLGWKESELSACVDRGVISGL